MRESICGVDGDSSEELSAEDDQAGDVGDGTNTMKIFSVYSHRDEDLRDELEVHLALLKHQDLIRSWHDREIVPGTDWNEAILEELESADLILLLVSSDFLASDFCYGTEMKRALERHEAREARAVPIILRECDWETAPFAKIQALPKNAQPVTSWRNKDEAWTSVSKGIRQILEDLAVIPERTDGDELAGVVTTGASSVTAVQDSGQAEYVDSPALLADDNDIEDEGLFDLVDKSNGHAAIATQTLMRIDAEIADLGRRMGERGKESEELKDPDGKLSPKNSKFIWNQVAMDMEQFSISMEARIPLYADQQLKMLDALTRAAKIQKEIVTDGETPGTVKTLKGLKAIIEKSSSQISSFRQTITSQGRHTTSFNRAKKKAASSVQKLLTELNAGHEMIEGTLKHLGPEGS